MASCHMGAGYPRSRSKSLSCVNSSLSISIIITGLKTYRLSGIRDKKLFVVSMIFLFRFIWSTCYHIYAHPLLLYLPRPQSPNYQRSRKAMGSLNTTSSTPSFISRTLVVKKMDRPLGSNDAPSRRLARQSSAPTLQPSLRPRIHTYTAQRRSCRAPTRTCRAAAATAATFLHRLASRRLFYHPRRCHH